MKQFLFVAMMKGVLVVILGLGLMLQVTSHHLKEKIEAKKAEIAEKKEEIAEKKAEIAEKKEEKKAEFDGGLYENCSCCNRRGYCSCRSSCNGRSSPKYKIIGTLFFKEWKKCDCGNCCCCCSNRSNCGNCNCDKENCEGKLSKCKSSDCKSCK